MEQSNTVRRSRWPVIFLAVRWFMLAALFVLLAALGYGIRMKDAQAMRVFAEAARRWQQRPDFRHVAVEYVRLSSDALQSRPFGLGATPVIMTLRSLPFVPEHLRANDSSRAHYNDFACGPLAAYLRLTSEQGVEDFIGSVEELGRTPNLSDEQVRAFLTSFKTDIPVICDDGAVRSVRKLLADVNTAARPFAIRSKIATALGPHVQNMAAPRSFPSELTQMTAPQQRYLLDDLDDEVREANVELWRTKQVSDFLSGVWAQTYGPMYAGIIEPLLKARTICQFAAPALLALIAIWCVYRLRSIAHRRTRTHTMQAGAGAH